MNLDGYLASADLIADNRRRAAETAEAAAKAAAKRDIRAAFDAVASHFAPLLGLHREVFAAKPMGHDDARQFRFGCFRQVDLVVSDPESTLPEVAVTAVGAKAERLTWYDEPDDDEPTPTDHDTIVLITSDADAGDRVLQLAAAIRARLAIIERERAES